MEPDVTRTVSRCLRAFALGVLLAVQSPGLPLVAGLAVGAFATDAQARSSGGYSRPSRSFSRTPSFSGGGGYSRRTPSFSGGYSRPSYSAPSRTPSFVPSTRSQSYSDRNYSQERSGNALRSFRAQQEQARRPAAPSGGFGGPSFTQPTYRQPSYAPSRYRGYNAPGRSNWYAGQGWAPPTTFGGQRRFGIWDGLFLWSLLSNLNRPGAGEFFYNRQNDPGYQQWRAEADRLARDNADLRQKLTQLDQQVAAKQGQPLDPNYLPPDVPKDVATAPPPSRTPSVAPLGGGGTSSMVWVVLLVGLGVLGYLAWRRMRPAGGAGAGRGGPMTPLQTASAMLQHKLSGDAYTPERFRVGMTVAVDPTPFILAADSIKVPQPEGGGANGLVSVKAVGRIATGGGQITRLYLPDDRSMIQVHVDTTGVPDECRLFATIDEVTPADRDEWGAWLDPNEGMIGWPEFQTKDGKVYGRIWNPGSSRVPPRALEEAIEGVDGKRTVRSQAMLYGMPTGAPDPAPPTEYILVSAIEDGGRARVAVRAGIDVNPTTLQLS